MLVPNEVRLVLRVAVPNEVRLAVPVRLAVLVTIDPYL